MLIATESLTRIDKLRLIEQFWEELSHAPDEVASPTWHADALADAERAVANGEAGFMDWEEAKERLRQGRA
ncbi:MAG: addiction module protein [Sulfuricellaceae bacterium]|nr:addiction module protein [Sulfuricellaceae bacterium]